ncbi:MAG TPA: integration host factor [Firmicutes bacterium]|nr:integration host factor [Bacillota bacterium]HHY97126.1 integration host factor [Bacillota bacterium]
MPLPVLTSEQKLLGLKKAQEMRSRRARIRECLKDGELSLQAILSAPYDDVISGMRVTYLLESLPGIGRVKTRRIMAEVGIHESRRIQGLGVRQREALLKRLAK